MFPTEERKEFNDFLKSLLPEDVVDDITELSRMQARITVNLRLSRAISLKYVKRYNELCYKLYPERQKGEEFEKEEAPTIPRARKTADVPPTELFGFDKAIRLVKGGSRCTRIGWNGKGQYIQIACNISYMTKGGKIVNAHHSNIGSSAIAFVGSSGVQLGWLASQADMLAEDWLEYRDE